MADGAVDAIVVDRWVGSFVLADNSIRGIRIAGAAILRNSSAIAVKKGNSELLKEINTALTEIKKDGTYTGILARWQPKEIVFQTRDQVFRQRTILVALLCVLIITFTWGIFLLNAMRKRKQAEETLLESEEKYRTIFEEMLNGFALHEIICDGDGKPIDYRFLAVNPAFERMTGLVAQDIMGKTVLEVLPETEPYWIETYGRVALTGDPVFFENYHQGLDSRFEVTAYRPAEGQFACIFQDVTKRKKAEEERNALDSQLLQAQKIESIGTLAGGVAHDFNNIVGIILGNTEMALMDVPEWNPARRNLTEIRDACLRARDVTKQILAFSRQTEHELRPIQIDSVIHEYRRFINNRNLNDSHLNTNS